MSIPGVGSTEPSGELEAELRLGLLTTCQESSDPWAGELAMLPEAGVPMKIGEEDSVVKTSVFNHS